MGWGGDSRLPCSAPLRLPRTFRFGLPLGSPALWSRLQTLAADWGRADSSWPIRDWPREEGPDDGGMQCVVPKGTKPNQGREHRDSVGWDCSGFAQLFPKLVMIRDSSGVLLSLVPQKSCPHFVFWGGLFVCFGTTWLEGDAVPNSLTMSCSRYHSSKFCHQRSVCACKFMYRASQGRCTQKVWPGIIPGQCVNYRVCSPGMS